MRPDTVDLKEVDINYPLKVDHPVTSPETSHSSYDVKFLRQQVDKPLPAQKTKIPSAVADHVEDTGRPKTMKDTANHNSRPLYDHHPPPTLENHSFSLLKVLTICAFAATFVFVCYIIIIKIWGALQSRRRRRRIINSRLNPNAYETPHQDLIHEDLEPVVFHPIWLINTVGLDQSVIDSIEVFKYRKEDGLIDSDCPVCLGVFQQGDILRLLPKCSHAFHVECIDMWLRSHINCPLCRAPVVNNTSTGQDERNSVESGPQEEIPFNIREMDANGGVRVQSDLTNNCSKKLEPMRRSVSMESVCFAEPNAVWESGEHRGSGSSASVLGREMSLLGPRIDLEEI
ncbi:E3 ubiquitin-protein ligase RING1-like [Bidens hawaiensis]|uniref:E3 ubiquitin-protein ligase RING1-like n=1 Tax=Bidens hawaiensis TaxID=980011 RepID=UPI00404B603E